MGKELKMKNEPDSQVHGTLNISTELQHVLHIASTMCACLLNITAICIMLKDGHKRHS